MSFDDTYINFFHTLYLRTYNYRRTQTHNPAWRSTAHGYRFSVAKRRKYMIMEEARNVSNNCSGTDLRQLMLKIKVSIGAVSIVACITAALLACVCRVGRRFTHRISLYLLLAVAFNEVTHCLQYSMYDYQPMNNFYNMSCEILGALLQLSAWTMLLFTTVLVFHLACLTILIEIRSTILIGVTYRVLILTLSKQETEVTYKAKRQAWCLEISYILIPILVPMSFLWIPFINDAYGMAGTWCWIRSEDDFCEENLAGSIERYALWFIPLILLCVINMITIAAILVILCKRLCIEKTSDKVYRNMLWENAPLLTYPVINNFFSLFLLARGLYETIPNTNNNQVLRALMVMNSVASPTRGLIFALAYCLFIVIERHYWKQHHSDTSVTRCGHERDSLIRSEFRMINSTPI